MHTSRKQRVLLILAFSVLAFLVTGYHPGIEDDGVYLAAIKSNLNPSLFAFDGPFFRTQLQATVFDKWIAGLIHLTHLSVASTELMLQFSSIVVILLSGWSLLRYLFNDERAHWAGVAMLGAMFTLPVAGTALYILDQHLHPRTIATALILWAVTRIVGKKQWQAIPLLAIAFVIHPIMGAMGLSFSCILTLTLAAPVLLERMRSLKPGRDALKEQVATMAAAVPLGWILEPPTPLWHKALNTRTYYFLFRWTWYEWLGAIAPLFLFWLLWQIARKRKEEKLARFALAVFIYGVFQQMVAFVLLTPSALVRLTPLQPMRYLQLVYIFMVLIGGALLGRHLLRNKVWRWAIFLLVFNGSMFLVQRQAFAGGAHLELPSTPPSSPWLQAFDWIRQNTPERAYFALDPRYMDAPGEDYHSFRALSERSQLADAIKDTAVVTQVPELGPKWDREVRAQAGWKHFRQADFERLKAEFGVDWVLVYNAQTAGLDCRWHNEMLTVCRIP